MRKFLTLTAFVISIYSFSQARMKFEEPDFKTVLAKAKKENKLVITLGNSLCLFLRQNFLKKEKFKKSLT